MHRADAALALGVEYALDPDIAADAVDEWMELGPTSRRPRRSGDWSRTCCWRPIAAAPQRSGITGDAMLVDFWLERVAFG